jgi:uncharacterized protein YggU (UPF0235/DUF167 family)
MIIRVRAKPAAKSKPRLTLVESDPAAGDLYDAFTDQPAQRGHANAAIRKLIANYFAVPTANVRLLTGPRSKFKRFTIDSKTAAPR